MKPAVPPCVFAIAAAVTEGATLSTMIDALAVEPPLPTAYTVWEPLEVPVGIVTERVALPLPPIGLGVVEPVRTVPLVGLSSRNVIVSPGR